MDEVLQAFAEMSMERGPTVSEMRRRLRLSSKSVAFDRLRTLAERGYIERITGDPRDPRDWRLTEAGKRAIAQ